MPTTIKLFTILPKYKHILHLTVLYQTHKLSFALKHQNLLLLKHSKTVGH